MAIHMSLVMVIIALFLSVVNYCALAKPETSAGFYCTQASSFTQHQVPTILTGTLPAFFTIFIVSQSYVTYKRDYVRASMYLLRF